MLAIRDTHMQQCADLSCKPIRPLVEELEAAQAQGVELDEIALRGSSKALFSDRVQPMQVLALCETLKEDTHIVSLDLTNNFHNDLAAQAIAGLIKSSSCIQRINLGGNLIGPQGTSVLCKALASPRCTLQSLSLSGNPLGEDGTMAIGNMLRANTSLRTLDISNVGAAIKGLVCVCNALGADGGEAGPCNTTLQALDVGAPVIHVPQDTVILSLARMLASNTSLTSLGLSKHRMVDSQLETLVTYGLLRNKSITSLDLRANRLSGFSGAQLERLLSEAPHLTALDLASNMLGDAGALALARSLPYCNWLVSLDARSNNIGEHGLVALAEALSMSPHLHTLLVWGNVFGPASSRAFSDTLAGLQGSGAQLRIDVQPFEVDGRAQLAFLQVD